MVVLYFYIVGEERQQQQQQQQQRVLTSVHVAHSVVSGYITVIPREGETFDTSAP